MSENEPHPAGPRAIICPPPPGDSYSTGSDRYPPGSAEPVSRGVTDRWLRAMVTTIAVILCLGVMFVAADLLVPIVIAAIAYLTLRPTETRLCRFGMPRVVASGTVIFTLFATLALIISLLYSPAQRWIDAAPRSLARVRENIQSIAKPLTTIDRADSTIESATSAVDKSPQEVKVSLEKPSMVDESTLINQTGRWLGFVAAIAVLTFFMLSTGDDLLNRILTLLPSGVDRDGVLERIGEIQRGVGTYLTQITCINVGLGVVVTLVMWLIGMPTPVLWGVMATLFNYVPYVGALAGTAIVFLAAASAFDTTYRAAATAFAFWLTTAVEGQFVTPAVLGKTLKVGPVVVLIAVAFWGFLWGLPGVFLAVPLLIVQRKVFSSFEATYAVAVVLGEEPRGVQEESEPVQEDQPIAETA